MSEVGAQEALIITDRPKEMPAAMRNGTLEFLASPWDKATPKPLEFSDAITPLPGLAERKSPLNFVKHVGEIAIAATQEGPERLRKGIKTAQRNLNHYSATGLGTVVTLLGGFVAIAETSAASASTKHKGYSAQFLQDCQNLGLHNGSGAQFHFAPSSDQLNMVVDIFPIKTSKLDCTKVYNREVDVWEEIEKTDRSGWVRNTPVEAFKGPGLIQNRDGVVVNEFSNPAICLTNGKDRLRRIVQTDKLFSKIGVRFRSRYHTESSIFFSTPASDHCQPNNGDINLQTDIYKDGFLNPPLHSKKHIHKR